MDDLVSMTIFDRTDDLLEEPPCLILLHLPLVHDIVKQLSPSVFDDHNDIRWSGYHFVKLDDMGVTKDFKVLDLPFHSGGHFEVFNLVTIEDFHGDFVTCDGMGSH